jgi:hypothetical protein
VWLINGMFCTGHEVHRRSESALRGLRGLRAAAPLGEPDRQIETATKINLRVYRCPYPAVGFMDLGPSRAARQPVRMQERALQLIRRTGTTMSDFR